MVPTETSLVGKRGFSQETLVKVLLFAKCPTKPPLPGWTTACQAAAPPLEGGDAEGPEPTLPCLSLHPLYRPVSWNHTLLYIPPETSPAVTLFLAALAGALNMNPGRLHPVHWREPGSTQRRGQASTQLSAATWQGAENQNKGEPPFLVRVSAAISILLQFGYCA